jgi:hypothetical protein
VFSLRSAHSLPSYDTPAPKKLPSAAPIFPARLRTDYGQTSDNLRRDYGKNTDSLRTGVAQITNNRFASEKESPAPASNILLSYYKAKTKKQAPSAARPV